MFIRKILGPSLGLIATIVLAAVVEDLFPEHVQIYSSVNMVKVLQIISTLKYIIQLQVQFHLQDIPFTLVVMEVHTRILLQVMPLLPPVMFT